VRQVSPVRYRPRRSDAAFEHREQLREEDFVLDLA
jgi:hypothetical protein